MPINVLIIDDHPIVRMGLRSLAADSDVQVVGEAGTSAEGIAAAKSLSPDVILLDVRMDNDDGLQTLRQIKAEKPDLPVLMFSNYDNPTYVARAMAQGANGYVLKGVGREELLASIRKAASGADCWSPTEVRRFTGALKPHQNQQNLEVALTHRESEVLHQMAYGLTNKEIAEALNISYETVKEHVQHILKKLGLSDRTQAAVWAVRKGLV